MLSGVAGSPKIVSPEDLLKIEATIEYEEANSKTNDFIGTLTITNSAYLAKGEEQQVLALPWIVYL